jgi:hypothetical protein
MADRKRPKYKAPLGSPKPKKPVNKPKKTMTPKEKRVKARKEAGKVSPQVPKKVVKQKPVSRGGIRYVAKATQKVAASQAGKAAAAKIAAASAARMGIFARGATKFAKSRFGVPAAVFTVGAIAVDYARKAFDESKKRRLAKDFGSRMRSSIKSAKGSSKDKPGKHDPYTGYYGPLAPLETKKVKDTRAKKTVTPRTTGASGDGPGPTPPTPKSVNREKQMRDFAKYNKAGSKIGMKMDDILRGAFSFMGALPKSTAKDKWKNK